MHRYGSCLLVLGSLVITVVASLGAVWIVSHLQPGGQSMPLPTMTIPAIVLPASTPHPASTPRPETYVVQRGDTLSIIALQFGVSVEALMEANNLSDADMIFVGQKLVIPAAEARSSREGISTRPPGITAASPLTSTPAIPPVSTASTPGALVEIDEITYPGDLARETVIIVNRGNRAIKLSGWTLTAPNGERYIFPNYDLWPGSNVRLHSAVGTDGMRDLFWGRNTPAWSARDHKAVLRDKAGRLVYEYP